MFSGKLSLFADTEVVSPVNFVKMRLGMFGFLPPSTRLRRAWRVHPTKNSMGKKIQIFKPWSRDESKHI